MYIFRSVITEPWNLRMSWEEVSGGHLVKCTCSINATNNRLSRAVSSQFLNIAGNTLTTVAQVLFVFFVTRVLAHVELGVQENPLVLLCKDVLPVCAGSWHFPSQMQNFACFLVEPSCWETRCPISPACCGLLHGSMTSGKSASVSFASPAHSSSFR